MGAIVRWIISKISAYLAQLAAEIAAYEKEKAVREARIAQLRREISESETLNQALENQIAGLDKKSLELQNEAANKETQLKAILDRKPVADNVDPLDRPL